MRGFTSDDQMNFGRLGYLVPRGYWGTRVGASVTTFSYKLGEEFASLLASGDGLVKSVYAFRPLYRTRNTNIIGQFAYEDKRLHDRVDDPDGRPRRSIGGSSIPSSSAWSAISATASLGGGLNAFSLTYTQGDLRIAPT